MRTSLFAALVAALMLLGASPAYSQTKKPVKPKPPVKKPAKTLGSLGTAQLPGDRCEIDKAYTLGKDNALNLRITSLEYKATRLKLGKHYVPSKDGTKFLIVHYTLQNPLPKIQTIQVPFDWTAVTGTDQNETTSTSYLESTGEPMWQELKPAQKVDLFSYFIVPAEKEVPKLMAASHEDGNTPVARFDLRGKVGKVPAPYADASDATGATALNVVPGKIGETYDTGDCDVSITKAEFVTDQITALNEDPMQEGMVYLLLTTKVTNFNVDSQEVFCPFFDTEVKDADGANYEAHSRVLRTSALSWLDTSIAFGDSLTFRRAFLVPKGVELKTVKIKHGEGRTILIDLGSIKG